jgi:cyclopropane fatty-acyl-phospholipid synthase-like methyltransferase
MLYYLKKYYGYTRTAGTQVSRNAFEFSKNILGLEIYDKDLLDLSFDEGAFDTISIWHVLEHVSHPEEYISKISALLPKGGKLVIEVPNFDSWSRQVTGRYWLGFDFKYHIFYFTPASLSRLLEKYGFEIKKIHTFSLEYSTFISAQSLLSSWTRSDHLFFDFLQTGHFSWRIIPQIIGFALVMPFCFIANLLFYFSKKGEVLLVVAKRSA